MLQDILNLEGVAVLNKEQQKNVKGADGPGDFYIGGLDENFLVRNYAGTGKAIQYNGGVWACQCTWEVKERTGWASTIGPCPSGPLQYSCV